MSVLNTVNLEEVKVKLYEKLKPSGWGDKLKTFIMSDDFDKILNFLLKEAQEGRRFTPVLKQMFRAFTECPYKDLKVVLIGQDPYPYKDIADGLAFSCSNDGKVQASLRYMFKELEDTMYPNGYTWDPDLARWSKQGILLLNSSLTTTINKVGQHYATWVPFMNFLIDVLNANNPGLVYVFLGKRAAEFSDMILDTNHKIFCTHPAFAAHQKADRWDSNGMFRKVSDLVKSHYNYDIVW